MTEDQILSLLRSNLVWILIAVLIFVVIFKGIQIVPQSEQYVVERFGRLRAVLGPGINLIVPFLDVVRHRISIQLRVLCSVRRGRTCNNSRSNVLLVDLQISSFVQKQAKCSNCVLLTIVL